MYYFLIFIVFLSLTALLSDSSNWSPFQSGQVKEICTHMTKTERRAAMKRAALWGFLIGIIPEMTGLVLGALIFRSALMAVTACFLIFPLLTLVLWKKWSPQVMSYQRRFLASTAWAKSQDIKAEDIQLYRWQDKP